MFSTLAKPIMISKHMYGVALTPYLPYVTLDITLIYEFRFTQNCLFLFCSALPVIDAELSLNICRYYFFKV